MRRIEVGSEKTHISDRRKARMVVVQILYQDDLNPQHQPSWDEDLIKRRLWRPELVEFGKNLLQGVRQNISELDRRIAAAAENWALSRMAVTDRNVLRLGAYELLYTATPPRVAIDEAVELAKLFGSQQSGQFVNGILDRLYRETMPAQALLDSNPPAGQPVEQPPLGDPS